MTEEVSPIEQLGIRVEKPEVYLDSQQGYAQAQRLFGEIKATGYFLPLGAEWPRELYGDAALQKVALETHLKEKQAGSPDQYPMAFTRVRVDGHTGFAVTISEEAQRLFPEYEGTRPFYRFGTIEQLALVREYGFFQIPGRHTFHTTGAKDGWGNNSIGVVFNLEHSEVVAGENNTAALAFPADGKFPDIKLPDEIRRTLKPLHFYVLGKSPHDQRTEHPSQVLLGGELAKVLLRIPPEKINIEESLRVNKNVLDNGKMTKEEFEQVEKLLEV